MDLLSAACKLKSLCLGGALLFPASCSYPCLLMMAHCQGWASAEHTCCCAGDRYDPLQPRTDSGAPRLRYALSRADLVCSNTICPYTVAHNTVQTHDQPPILQADALLLCMQAASVVRAPSAS